VKGTEQTHTQKAAARNKQEKFRFENKIKMESRSFFQIKKVVT